MKLLALLWKWIRVWLVVLLCLVVGSFAAGQAGWSGAEIVVNSPLYGFWNDALTFAFFAFPGSTVFAAALLAEKVTGSRRILWLLVPVFAYFAIVPGAWNGYSSDFDHTRLAVLKGGYANGYAIEHMTDRGRYLTCNDRYIELKPDARMVCEKALYALPGAPIPGSEHRCGFLKMFSCFVIALETKQ